MTVKNIFDFLNQIAPFDTAEEWDNCGLSVGSLEKSCSKIYIALDVTSAVIEDALNFGADLVITHHPLIFNPVSKVESESVLYKAVKSGMTFVSSHTCLDKAKNGVNDCLAHALGIGNISVSDKDAFLNIGEIEPCSVCTFAKIIKNALGGSVSFTDNNKILKKIAFCSGSGGDLVSLAAEESADALVTGEAKHHEYLLANELGIALFVAGHYETENIVCKNLEKLIKEKFGTAVDVKVSLLTAPVSYI